MELKCLVLEWITVREFLKDWKAVPKIMALLTKSTGTKSTLTLGPIAKFLNIPRPWKTINKPPAAKESVQPGNGSEYEA